jgi:hypothetical protein
MTLSFLAERCTSLKVTFSVCSSGPRGEQVTQKTPVLRALLRPLILRRPLDVVDDEEAYGSVGGFEFQA